MRMFFKDEINCMLNEISYYLTNIYYIKFLNRNRMEFHQEVSLGKAKFLVNLKLRIEKLNTDYFDIDKMSCSAVPLTVLSSCFRCSFSNRHKINTRNDVCLE